MRLPRSGLILVLVQRVPNATSKYAVVAFDSSRARHRRRHGPKRHRSGELIAGATRCPPVVLRSPEKWVRKSLFQSRAHISHLAEIKMDNYEGPQQKNDGAPWQNKKREGRIRMVLSPLWRDKKKKIASIVMPGIRYNVSGPQGEPSLPDLNVTASAGMKAISLS